MGAEETEDEEEDEAEDPRVHRPTMHGRPDLEMNALGWILFGIMVVLLIPLLPALILAIVISKLLGLGGRRRMSWS